MCQVGDGRLTKPEPLTTAGASGPAIREECIIAFLCAVPENVELSGRDGQKDSLANSACAVLIPTPCSVGAISRRPRKLYGLVLTNGRPGSRP